MADCRRDDLAACEAVVAECDDSVRPRCAKVAQQSRERACQLGSALGCLEFARGLGERERADVHRVLELVDRACTLGEAKGCTLGLLFHGRAMDPGDDGNWVELRRRAKITCEAGDSSGCAALADLWALGLGGRRDTTRARDLDRQACEGEVPGACHNMDMAAPRYVTVYVPLFAQREDRFPVDAFTAEERRYYASLEARATLRVCVAASSPRPSDVVVVASSGVAAFDRTLAVGVRSWEMHRSPRLPEDVTVCPKYTFEVLEDALDGRGVEVVPFLPRGG